MRSKRYPFFSSSEGRCSLFYHEGKTYAFGKNERGQFGLGHKNAVSVPTELKAPFSGNVIKFACGDYHAIILTNEQKAYSGGSSGYGQTGVAYKKNKDDLVFRFVSTLKDHRVLDIATGYLHSFFITNKGVFACGRNNSGGCGIGTFKSVDIPTKVIFSKDVVIKKACGGCDFSVFLSNIGDVYLTGEMCHGSGKTNSPKKVKFNERIRDISAGHEHYVGITFDNKVFVSGGNGYGQCGSSNAGTISNLTNIKPLNKMNIQQISCGFWYTYVLAKNGDMFGFGGNDYGELGDREGKPPPSSYGVKVSNPCNKIASKVAQICGSGHSGFYVDIRGRVWATGENSSGELGLGVCKTKFKWTLVSKIPELKPIEEGGIPILLLFSLIDKKSFVDINIMCS